MTIYLVSTNDRQQARSIAAESPGDAMQLFLGQRFASFALAHWAANGREWFYNVTVKAGKGPYRMGRDAVASITGHVQAVEA
jgi:hypothetical protein